jgi:hypothetical protein
MPMEKLPRCTNPEIDDYPPWLLKATKDALFRFMEDPELEDARAVLLAIDAALAVRDPGQHAQLEDGK